MAKNLKLNIKNSQISKAVNLKGLKNKLAKKKEGATTSAPKKTAKSSTTDKTSKKLSTPSVSKEQELEENKVRKVKARTKSAFEAPVEVEPVSIEPEEKLEDVTLLPQEENEELPVTEETLTEIEEIAVSLPDPVEAPIEEVQAEAPVLEPVEASIPEEPALPKKATRPPVQKLGPTGRHINDLLSPKKQVRKEERPSSTETESQNNLRKDKPLREYKNFESLDPSFSENSATAKGKHKKMRPSTAQGKFDSRDRLGLRSDDDSDGKWRRKRILKNKVKKDEVIPDRPNALNIRTPIAIKDLASQMKLKASQLVSKLFMQGVIVTLNDYLDDETTIQLLGEEFACNITIDTSEEERIRITDKTIREEIAEHPNDEMILRAPVLAFMGHVDHGKTSLIDYIRKSNVAASESGAITQHIGAFRVSTSHGPLTILDTPGHEAFSAMRARGANVTDVIILVIAGDEGMKPQTEEAISHAVAAGVPLIVAINKCDKPGFNVDQVYRQLADKELLPEAWGGQTITINCSAATGEGISELLEMVALQSEVMELKAMSNFRARGSVIESQMHKGLGNIATLLVQNGTLRAGDAVVFNHHWGRVKNLYDDHGNSVSTAGPSVPVKMTGLSGLPEAGDEFIVVSSEKEARNIAETRKEDSKLNALMANKPITMESLLQEKQDSMKKSLNIILRADVQGSLEALQAALLKIKSDKIDLQIIFQGVGEISESDLHLAAASKALVVGFHSHVESHADSLVKPLGVQVKLFEIIYDAVDTVKGIMTNKLDKLVFEEDQAEIEIRTVFKASQLGKIAGCQVLEGTVKRSQRARLLRKGEVIWKGNISSLKREKDDVKEVAKGFECGILLSGTNDIEEGDIIQTYELRYEAQEL